MAARIRATIFAGALVLPATAFSQEPPSEEPPREETPRTEEPRQEEPPEAKADAVKQDEQRGARRILGGHELLLPTLVDSALPLTYVGIRAGVEQQKVDNVPLDRLGRVDVSQMRAAEGLDLSLAITDMIQVFGTVGGYAALGTNTTSMLLRGASYLYGGGGGVQVRLLEMSNTVLSVRAAGAYSEGKVVNLRSLSLNLIEAPVATLADVVTGDAGDLLTTPLTTMSAVGGLNLAHGFTPMFSAQATLRVRWERQRYEIFSSERGERFDSDIKETQPQAAVAVGVDFDSLGVPVAALAEYQLARVLGENELIQREERDWEHAAAVGLFYSGRTDLQLGVTGIGRFGLERLELEDEGELLVSDAPQEWGGSFVLRTFW